MRFELLDGVDEIKVMANRSHLELGIDGLALLAD